MSKVGRPNRSEASMVVADKGSGLRLPEEKRQLSSQSSGQRVALRLSSVSLHLVVGREERQRKAKRREAERQLLHLAFLSSDPLFWSLAEPRSCVASPTRTRVIVICSLCSAAAAAAARRERATLFRFPPFFRIRPSFGLCFTIFKLKSLHRMCRNPRHAQS